MRLRVGDLVTYGWGRAPAVLAVITRIEDFEHPTTDKRHQFYHTGWRTNVWTLSSTPFEHIRGGCR